MLGRRDGNQVGNGVDSTQATRRKDRGKAMNPHIRTQLSSVEPHVCISGHTHTTSNRFRDHVPRSQVRHGVLPQHETLPGVVDQYRTLPANRFGYQGLLPLGQRAQPHDRGMELNEFKIGNGSTGTQGERNTVAGGHVGISGLPENLTEPSGGQHHDRRQCSTHTVPTPWTDYVQGHPNGNTAVVLQ